VEEDYSCSCVSFFRSSSCPSASARLTQGQTQKNRPAQVGTASSLTFQPSNLGAFLFFFASQIPSPQCILSISSAGAFTRRCLLSLLRPWPRLQTCCQRGLMPLSNSRPPCLPHMLLSPVFSFQLPHSAGSRSSVSDPVVLESLSCRFAWHALRCFI